MEQWNNLLAKELSVAYVITAPCKGVVDLACIDVCPVDCIHGPEDPTGRGKELANIENRDDLMVYINPAECIDCAACVHVCPVFAIFPEEKVPKKWQEYIALNAGFFK